MKSLIVTVVEVVRLIFHISPRLLLDGKGLNIDLKNIWDLKTLTIINYYVSTIHDSRSLPSCGGFLGHQCAHCSSSSLLTIELSSFSSLLHSIPISLDLVVLTNLLLVILAILSHVLLLNLVHFQMLY